MEYLHVIPMKSSGIAELIRQMEQYCDIREHTFFVMVSRQTIIKSAPELLAFSNIECFEAPSGRFARFRKQYRLRKRLERADIIIWHSLFVGGGSYVPILYRNKQLCQKSVWIENGLDVEDWVHQGNSRKQARDNHMNTVIRSRIPIVGVPLGADIPYIKSLWPEKTVVELPYPISYEYAQAIHKLQKEKELQIYNQTKLEQIIEESRRQEEEEKKQITFWLDFGKETGPAELNNDLPTVQVGLSSQRANRHLDLINILSRFAGKPMNGCMPHELMIGRESLGTGGKTYVAQVKKQAEQVFGDRFRILNEKIDAPAFFESLNKLDIALLGGMTSFEPRYLLYLIGAKVKLYLPNESWTYDYLSRIGYPAHSLEELQTMSFDQFVAPDYNCTIPVELNWYYDCERVMSIWKQLFADLRKQVML